MPELCTNKQVTLEVELSLLDPQLRSKDLVHLRDGKLLFV